MGEKERVASKEVRWRELIRRQAASGLSVRAFCRQESIREPSFYFWRRTLRERGMRPSPSTPAFVPAEIRALPPGEQAITLPLGAGRVLRLPVGISTTWLAELIRALDDRGDQR